MKKEKNEINSEKITMQLRSHIYDAFVSKISKKSEINDISEKIRKVFFDYFMSDYFDNKKDIEFFENHQNLLNYVYVHISPETLDIEITKERHKVIDFKLSITFPVLSENQPGLNGSDVTTNKKLIIDFLKKHKILGAIKRMYQEYMDLIIQDETSCDKYFSTQPPRWRHYENFCSECTTTLQLKNKYPEVYQVYLEISRRNSKETLIEDLRRKLGFI